MSKRPYDHSPLSVKLVCHNCLSACFPHRLHSAVSLLCPLIQNLVFLLITHLTTYQPSSSKDSPQNITHYHDHSSMSVSTAHYYTYLVNIMITMHPLFQHHSCNLLLSNMQHRQLINFHHTCNNSSCSKTYP